MAANEMFGSALRASSDLAGVFEYDGETGYFYLYDTKRPDGDKMVSAIQVITGIPDFLEPDVMIQWDGSERMVGLFIKQRLWAVFDAKTGLRYGSTYRADAQPSIPEEIVQAFQPQ